LSSKNTSDLLIVGAGAAGLCAAILSSKAGVRVTILEQNDKVGKKILVSGNGKCNIANRHISPHRFHSQNPDFVRSVLQGYDFGRIETFFTSLGLPLIEGAEGKMFPMSMQAASVVDILAYEAQNAGVRIVCECKVQKVDKRENGFFLETTQGTMQSDMLLIATGSPAAPQLGGGDWGYRFAKEMSHSLVPGHPALVQLRTEESWVKRCAGVKMRSRVTLYANREEIVQKEGDILFTDYGVSGLAVLDISREASIRLASFDYCELSIDLMPDYSKEQLSALLIKNIKSKSQKPILLWLQGILHKKMAKVILEKSKIKSETEGELHRKEINKLVHTLKNLKLSINDTKGFKHAEVTTGGIDTRKIDPETMASKTVSGLYFAGEVLDVDGDRGGYNFHFAWVSGMRAAKAIGENLKRPIC